MEELTITITELKKILSQEGGLHSTPSTAHHLSNIIITVEHDGDKFMVWRCFSRVGKKGGSHN